MPWHILVFNFNLEIVEKLSNILIHSVIDTLLFVVKVESSAYCKIQYSLISILFLKSSYFFYFTG